MEIDFAALDHVNATGMRVMLMAAKTIKVDNRQFTLCDMQANLRQLSERNGFHKIIAVIDDCAAAAAEE